MAQTVDIAPSVGHALLNTQTGVGASPGYDAIDDRRFLGIGLVEGAVSKGGWRVRERAAGANMTVEVVANVDPALVQGDSVTNQGLYTVAPHSAVVSLDVPAAHASNPRVDMVVLKVTDATHDGGTDNKATLQYLTGTASSGATLDNRTGAPSVPASALRLAEVLVPAASSTVISSRIRDFRPYALKMAEIGQLGFFLTGQPAGWQPTALGFNKLVFDRLWTAAQDGGNPTQPDTYTFTWPSTAGRAFLGAGGGIVPTSVAQTFDGINGLRQEGTGATFQVLTYASMAANSFIFTGSVAGQS